MWPAPSMRMQAAGRQGFREQLRDAHARPRRPRAAEDQRRDGDPLIGRARCGFRHRRPEIESDLRGVPSERGLQCGIDAQPGSLAVPVVDETGHGGPVVAVGRGPGDKAGELRHFAEEEAVRRIRRLVPQQMEGHGLDQDEAAQALRLLHREAKSNSTAVGVADEMEGAVPWRLNGISQHRIGQRGFLGQGEGAVAGPRVALAIAVEIRCHDMAVRPQPFGQGLPLRAGARRGVEQEDGLARPRRRIGDPRAVQFNL